MIHQNTFLDGWIGRDSASIMKNVLNAGYGNVNILCQLISGNPSGSMNSSAKISLIFGVSVISAASIINLRNAMR